MGTREMVDLHWRQQVGMHVSGAREGHLSRSRSLTAFG